MEDYRLTIVVILLTVCITQLKTPTVNTKSSSKEEEYLSKLINSEADQSDILDMQLIGSTVLNRVDDTSFPDDIYSVIHQYGQYDGVETPQFKRSELSDKIAQDLLKGIGRNYKVLYFFNYKSYTDTVFVSWLRNNRKLIHKNSHHEFY